MTLGSVPTESGPSGVPGCAPRPRREAAGILDVSQAPRNAGIGVQNGAPRRGGFWGEALGLPVGVAWLLLLGCSGGEPTDAALNEAVASAEARARGRVLFEDRCRQCHGPNAAARNPGARQPPDFSATAWQQDRTPRMVYRVVRDGRPGTAMPGWKSLGDRALLDLVAYLKSRGAAHSVTRR